MIFSVSIDVARSSFSSAFPNYRLSDHQTRDSQLFLLVGLLSTNAVVLTFCKVSYAILTVLNGVERLFRCSLVSSTAVKQNLQIKPNPDPQVFSWSCAQRNVNFTIEIHKAPKVS